MKLKRGNRKSKIKFFLFICIILVSVSLKAQSEFFLIQVNDSICFKTECNKVVNYSNVINPLYVKNVFFYDKFLANSKDMPKTIKLFDSIRAFIYLNNFFISSSIDISFPDSLNNLEKLYSITMSANLSDSTFPKSLCLPSLERLVFGYVNLKDTSGFVMKFPNLRILSFDYNYKNEILIKRFLVKISDLKKLEKVYISIPDDMSIYKKRNILKWTQKLKKKGVNIELY